MSKILTDLLEKVKATMDANVAPQTACKPLAEFLGVTPTQVREWVFDRRYNPKAVVILGMQEWLVKNQPQQQNQKPNDQ